MSAELRAGAAGCRIAGTLLLTLMLIAAGCARQMPFSDQPQVATREVQSLVPKGASETRARKALTDRGFQISRLSSDHATNHLLVCSYSRDDTLWQIGLIIIEGKVAASSVTITDTRGARP